MAISVATSTFGDADCHALTRDGLLLHHERDEPALRPVRLDLPEDVGALELLVQCARPAETGRERIGVRPDVVPAQRVADLEPQRVARAEPTWHDTALDHSIPQLSRILVHAHQLAAVL